MTLDQAMKVIDDASFRSPKLVDWNAVEEASMVIVAETGRFYYPWKREEHRAPAPSSRGTPDGYDAAVHGEPDEFDVDDGAVLDPDAIDLEGDVGGEDRYLARVRSGQELGAEWSRRARGQL